jgi:hypothetical protein
MAGGEQKKEEVSLVRLIAIATAMVMIGYQLRFRLDYG